jgi:uncharacterized membrane protein YoaK (UPF0700 family)
MSALSARAAATVNHPLSRALLALTFTTGLVDAASYLGLGHVFTANMTGNVVLLGFGLAGGTGLPVLAPLVSLAAFLVGSRAGGVLAAKLGQRHPAHIAAALAIEAGVILIAAVLAIVFTIHAGTIKAGIVIALLAFAMGVRNATVRRIGVPDLTTTVLTMTLTGLAADGLSGKARAGVARRVAAVIAMLAGALIGALLLKSSLALPLVAAAGLAAVTWLVYVPAARREVPAARREAQSTDDAGS